MLINRPKIPIGTIILTGFLPGFLKKLLYRLKGYKIGKGVTIGPGSVVIGEKVSIEDHVTIGFLTVIRGKEIGIKRFVQIGSLTMIDTERFYIDEDSRINEKVIVGGIRTPESSLKIGKRVIIMEYSFINPTKPIVIGDDTGIGGHSFLFTHGSWLSVLEGFPVAFAPITLGNNVWLPWRVFIMPGVTIGDRVVIGANSLINSNLPSNVMAAGSPAKILKNNFPPEISPEKRNELINQIIIEFFTFIKYSGLAVKQSEFRDVKIFEVLKKNKIHRLIYLDNPDVENTLSQQDYDLLVTDKINSDVINLKFKMKLDLVKKNRKGKSELGEEFCRFISRYGIRFDRID